MQKKKSKLDSIISLINLILIKIWLTFPYRNPKPVNSVEEKPSDKEDTKNDNSEKRFKETE